MSSDEVTLELEMDEDELRPSKPLCAERKQEIDELLGTISELVSEIIS